MTTLAPAATNASVPDRYQHLANLLAGRVSGGWRASEAEWDELLSLAQAEGVGPLLDRVVEARPDLEAPSPVRRALAAIYLAAAHESRVRQSVRERLCRQFAERGIPTLLLKGAALALTCYEDPVTRPMADLDLLIPAGWKEAAANCLEEEGFQPLSGSRADELQSARAHLCYVHPARRTMVEVHWELKLFGPAQGKALAEIWAAAPSDSGGAAPVMRLGHTLPLICAHMLLQHRQPRLLWLYDLHRVLLTMDAAEAARARDAAIRWGLAPCTALALLHTQRLFGTRLPPELASWAQAAIARRGVQARVAAHVLGQEGEAPSRRMFDLLLNRNYSPWWVLVPAPHDMRRLLGLGAGERVGPLAYAGFLLRRLRTAPVYLRELWRFWRTAPRPPAADAPDPPLPTGDPR